MTAFSITMHVSASVTGWPSATMLAPNMMRHPGPMRTSPQIVALDAT
jgi:hypothetical protein